MAASRLPSWLPLAATLALCSMIIGPEIDIQVRLAQGDLGRDLYAGAALLQGELPYRDYSWQYGPLMPFYHAVFQALFGVGIKSALLGVAVLRAATALTVFAILRKRTTPGIAILGCWWILLFHREFSHTFSHPGAFFCLALVTLFILRYVDDARPRDLIYGSVVSCILMLQKPNIGMIGLAGLSMAAAYIELRQGPSGRRARIAAMASVPVAIIVAASIYLLLLFDLPEYAVRQSLLFLPEYRIVSLSLAEGLDKLSSIFFKNLRGLRHVAVGSLLALAGLSCWLFSLRRRQSMDDSSSPGIVMIGFLCLLSLHEVVMTGFAYRLAWSDGFVTLLIFLFVWELRKRLGPRAGAALMAGLVVFCVYSTGSRWVRVARFRTPEHWIAHERLEVYSNNDALWQEVVLETTRYLDENVAPDERFFVAPYDPLYYFLAAQPAPTRSNALLEFMHVTEEQEMDIMEDLNRENVRWIVLSNRAWASEEVGVGVFGETHARVLAAWIEENFEVVREIGPQDVNAGWIRGHATRIYRRRDPPGEPSSGTTGEGVKPHLGSWEGARVEPESDDRAG